MSAQGNLRIEIIPGKSIGPLRFGMTREEVGRAIQTFAGERTTLEDLNIEVKYDVHGRCNEQRIRIFNNPHEITFHGHIVRDNQESVQDLFAHLFPDAEMQHSYACREWPSLGVIAVKWESSDDWLDSLWLVPVVDKQNR